MTDTKITGLLIAIFILLCVYGCHMNYIRVKNFDLIPYGYEMDFPDSTKCFEKLKGERKFKWNKGEKK